MEMFQLYCYCGYPLWVAAHWTGSTIELFLLDGTREADRSQPPLQQCPQCKAVLRPDQLEGYALLPPSAARPSSDHEGRSPPSVSPPAARKVRKLGPWPYERLRRVTIVVMEETSREYPSAALDPFLVGSVLIRGSADQCLDVAEPVYNTGYIPRGTCSKWRSFQDDQVI
jgi:hypothetical protein